MIVTFLVSIVGFALLMGLMALGVMLGGRRLAGSCGGNPDSAHCGCSPEKKQECRVRARAESDEDALFSGSALSAETLAPPGEQRLIQLRTGRR